MKTEIGVKNNNQNQINYTLKSVDPQYWLAMPIPITKKKMLIRFFFFLNHC